MIDTVTAFLANPLYLSLSLGAIIAAAILLTWENSRKLTVSAKILLIYLHIALLLTPLAIFAYSSGCGIPLYSCAGKAAFYASPLILAGIITGTGVLGYFFLPRLYRRRFGTLHIGDITLRRFISEQSKKHGIRKPSIHVIQGAVPRAFSFSSFKPAIFISVGMLDIMTRKEIEAVLLHEIGHLASKSSFNKFFSRLMKVVSPVAMFSPPLRTAVDKEEALADEFAVKEQKTAKYLESARRKVERFLNF